VRFAVLVTVGYTLTRPVIVLGLNAKVPIP
jgi:hypothetical protein